jgi:hypothetical protein
MATRRWSRRLGRRSCITLALASLVTTSLPLADPAVATARTRPVYDVSLGDSYGAGYQPVASARTGRDTGGFAYQVVGLAKARGYDFTLRNFAATAPPRRPSSNRTGAR